MLEWTVAAVTAGIDRPLVLLAIPVVAVLLGVALLRRREGTTFGRRERALLFASRLCIATLVIVAAAGPYTVATRQVTGEPQVTLLVDRSTSLEPTEGVAGEVASAVESRGVEVNTRVIADGDRSPIGDGIAAALDADGHVVVASDGQVTGGRSLESAAALAEQVNATVHAINRTATTTERAVRVSGPAKTSTGVSNAFRVGVDGVALDEEATVTVSVDGETVEQRTVAGAGAFEVSRTFSETGSHRVTVRVDGDDRFARNDVARTTVRVVEPPRILYVARGEYPFEGFLRDVYDVDRAQSIPDDLSPYYAVVIQDVAASDLGNVTALQRAVVDGTGLVTVGGENAFEHGGYRDSIVTDVLPVRLGDGGQRSRIVLAVDVSGSTDESLSVQQALALDTLDQLGDENQVGLVAFNRQAGAIADLRRLGDDRDALRETIRRLQSGGGTNLAAGVAGAGEMLGDGTGTVILLSDGHGETGRAPGAAAEVAANGGRVITIGVGADANADYLRSIADAGDGPFLWAQETNRLRILFGGDSREYRGDALTVLDRDHFVTSGVEFAATPGRSNEVTPEPRADYLVAGPAGNPAVTAWRYGLGRSVAVTAYGPDGTLDGLLSPPDSLALTKSVNWAIGDPERLASGRTDVSDARVGDPATVTYEGTDRPRVDGLSFSRVGDGEYRATIVPDDEGYESVLGAAYAVNYPSEYARFGMAPALRSAVQRTGGQVYEPGEAAAIAADARERATAVRPVETEWGWLALVVALVAFVLECSVRRLYRIRQL